MALETLEALMVAGVRTPGVVVVVVVVVRSKMMAVASLVVQAIHWDGFLDRRSSCRRSKSRWTSISG